MNDTLPLQRRALIAQRLNDGQPVSAAALSAEFGVSEDAIRRDLRSLAAEGLCRRVYGGALPAAPAGQPIAVRKQTARVQKSALARSAAATIGPGEFVFLDCGSTNLELAPFLPDGVRVATNSIDIAAALGQRPDIQLMLIGGIVTPHLGGSVDVAATAAVSRLNIDRLFLGACAVGSPSGISAFDPADADFKRALLAASERVIVMATNDKLGTRAPFKVAQLDRISHLFIEHDAPDELVQPLLAAGASIRKAEPWNNK